LRVAGKPDKFAAAIGEGAMTATQIEAGSKGRAYVLGILTLVYAFNFIDRQMVGFLAEFIRLDMGLSDTQLGILSGPAFAVLYAVAGLPLAMLADRTRRVVIIAAALATWSLFTILFGLAGSFLGLLLARICVGIGEAGGTPPSHAILSDLYRPEEKARALGIYALGIPLGTMAACFIVAALVGSAEPEWRHVFFAIGAPGILLAAVVLFTVKEPPRGGIEAGARVHAGFKEALATLVRIPSYWAMALDIAFASFGGYAVGSWFTAYVLRVFDEPQLRAALGGPFGIDGMSGIQLLFIAQGLVNATFYIGGVALGGVIADRWARRSTAGIALTPIVGLVIAVPIFMLGVWSGAVWPTLFCLGLFLFFSGFYLGPSFSVAQNLAPVRVRATSTAIFFFVLNMIALAGGPFVIGALSDFFAQGRDAATGLRLSLTSLIVPYLLAVAAFGAAALWLPRDLERSRRASSSAH
jgi:MFS family permease